MHKNPSAASSRIDKFTVRLPQLQSDTESDTETDLFSYCYRHEMGIKQRKHFLTFGF